MSEPPIVGNELARVLLALEERYGSKKRLARAVSQGARPGSAGRVRSSLKPLQDEVAEINRELLRLDHASLEALCRRPRPEGREAPYLHELFFGERGILALAQRESEFLAACGGQSGEGGSGNEPEAESATAVFAGDLLDDAGQFRRALRELRACARAPLQVRSLGFGEMSHPVTLERRPNLLARALPAPALVFKRMAPFTDAAMAAEYVRKYNEYNRRLRDDVGLRVPDFASRTLRDPRGQTVVYCLQARLDPAALAKSILRKRDPKQCRILFHMVLEEYRKMIRYNRQDPGFQIGVDGQIPNWVVRDYPGDDSPLNGTEGLWFIDTNTPMMRTKGRECLPLSFYLRGLPRLIRPLIRPLAKSVLDRYFNPRTILLDFRTPSSPRG